MRCNGEIGGRSFNAITGIMIFLKVSFLWLKIYVPKRLKQWPLHSTALWSISLLCLGLPLSANIDVLLCLVALLLSKSALFILIIRMVVNSAFYTLHCNVSSLLVPLSLSLVYFIQGNISCHFWFPAAFRINRDAAEWNAMRLRVSVFRCKQNSLKN